MIRPVTTGRTPDKLRAAKSLEDLRTAGGDRVRANLEAESLADLQAIQAHLVAKLGPGPARTKTEAIAYALRQTAKRLK